MVGSLLPAVITVDAPHATRSLLYLFLLGVGAALAYDKVKKGKWVIAGLLILETSVYLLNYFGSYPKVLPKAYPTGVKQALQRAYITRSSGQTIVMTNKSGVPMDILADQLYVWALLYGKVPPEEFTGSVQMTGIDTAGLVRVGGFHGIMITNELTRSPTNALLIERDATCSTRAATLQPYIPSGCGSSLPLSFPLQ